MRPSEFGQRLVSYLTDLRQTFATISNIANQTAEEFGLEIDKIKPSYDASSIKIIAVPRNTDEWVLFSRSGCIYYIGQSEDLSIDDFVELSTKASHLIDFEIDAGDRRIAWHIYYPADMVAEFAPSINRLEPLIVKAYNIYSKLSQLWQDFVAPIPKILQVFNVSITYKDVKVEVLEELTVHMTALPSKSSSVEASPDVVRLDILLGLEDLNVLIALATGLQGKFLEIFKQVLLSDEDLNQWAQDTETLKLFIEELS